MNKEIIKQIIEAGNCAPSGSNSQPWRFISRNNTIEVMALPEKDHPILNFRNRGTWLAHGALIENMGIASIFFGYEPTLELFPTSNISAKITVQKTEKVKIETSLYEVIPKRHTNRKPYKPEPLTEEEKSYLFQEINRFPECKLLIAEGINIQHISENLAFDVMLSLQNQVLHKHLFQEILWKEEEQKIRGGLYIKTMEVTPPKAFIFRLLSNWRIAKFFNKIKLPQKIYEENVKTISSSALIGAVAIDDKDIDFISAGRLMENIWLRTAKLNLGFQLITGIPFLWQQLNFGKSWMLSEKEKDIINRAYENLSKLFQVKNKIIALTFRIGKADQPLATSYKRPPIIDWE